MTTHAVQVDEDTLRASLEAAAASPTSPPPPGSSPPTPDAAQPAPSDPLAWVNEARLLASFLSHKVTPGWQVTPEVQEQWATALSGCLGRLMPGGLGNVAQWGPWGHLAYASAAWALCGFDMENFKFKPLAPKENKTPIEGQSRTEAPEGQPPASGGFKTSG